MGDSARNFHPSFQPSILSTFHPSIQDPNTRFNIMAKEIPLEKIDDYRWRIPKSYMQGMRVDGIVYANEKLLEGAKSDEALQQVANVAHLPGIVKHSLAMPDLHWGYGFVIGGVAATDPRADGVVSPGGIGYDINCGVRLIRTNITGTQLEGKTKKTRGEAI
jgi:tRNA-splicing ligase RtcB